MHRQLRKSSVGHSKKCFKCSAGEDEVWPEWIDYNRRGAAAFPINNVTSDSVKEGEGRNPNETV